MPVCPRCGQENPAGFRFCGACGAPLQVEEPREERKIVTALFADIVGSTARAEQLDPEDVRALLAPYYVRVRGELERYGGTVEKFIGDAVVALFGAPVVHEDDPERAVRAAFAVRQAVAELDAADPWFDLHIRIGINTGEALVVVGARASEGEGMAAGDVMNTAARLQAAAPVDGILVSEATHAASELAIDYRPAEPVQAKGKSEPVPVWEAVAVRDAPVRRRVSHAPLVGREAELERLAELWMRVRRDARPGFAAILGQPGIGKTRLLVELTERLGETAAVHWGRCLPYGEGITYWPVAEILKDAAGILQSDEAAEVSEKLGALLELLPTENRDELRTMAAALANLIAVPTTPLGTYSAERITQAELHWGIRRVLRLLAAAHPLVLVFEDLHWAEPTLLELIRYLSEEAEGAPMLLLGSARPELAEAEPTLTAESERRQVLALEALGEGESEALLAELLLAEGLPDASLDRVLAVAGGNPLFLEETVRMLVDAGLVESGDGDVATAVAELPVPSSLQALIGSRLDGLPAELKLLAQSASVIGRIFWPGALAHLNGAGGDLGQGLAELEQRDVIRPQETSTVAGEREYAFKHILIRDVAYAQVPKGRRVGLHVRCADWISLLSGGDEGFVEIVAYHLEQACRLALAVEHSPVAPPVRQAVEALARAAAKAERREGIREAERFYVRALELVSADDAETALELRLGRGRMLVSLGQLARARAELQDVADEAAARGRLDLRAAALIALGNVDGKQGRAGDANQRLVEAESIALQIAAPRLTVEAVYGLAAERAWFGEDARTAIEDVRRGLRIAERERDDPLRTEGYLRLGFLLFNVGELAHAEEALELCLALAREAGSHRDEARATFLLGLAKYYRGEPEAAEQLNLQAHEWFERMSDSYFQTQNLSRALAVYALARDDAPRAEVRLQGALPLALEGGGWVLAEIYRYLTETLVREGRMEEARTLAEFAARGVSGEDQYERASVLIAQGITSDEARGAQERFSEALLLLERLSMPIELGEARVAYARTLRALGRRTDAHGQLTEARTAFAAMSAEGRVAAIDRELAELDEGST